MAAAPARGGAVKAVAARALGVGLAIAVVAGLLQWWGVGLPLLLAAMVVVGFVAWAFPFYGVRLLDAAVLAIRNLYWARDQGHFHSFGGIPLVVEDDGRHVWMGGQGLLRVLGRKEAEDVLAARLSGQWRRDANGVLMLRADGVVQYLAHMPERTDPRVQKFRRYLEREVLFPASQRRRKS